MIQKFVFVFGTRPEAIKIAPLVLAAKDDPNLECLIVSTGQHREMLDQVLDAFAIKPDIDLDLINSRPNLNGIIGQSLLKLDKFFEDHKPDLVFAHGDTATTLAVSLCCFNKKIPLAHIEAGLRTYDLESPFPEEFNRRVAGLASKYHFCPTQLAKENLVREGCSENSLFVVGNTIVDAVRIIEEKISKEKSIQNKFDEKFSFLKSSDKVILLTVHRRESFGEKMKNICLAIKEIAIEQPNVKIVFPVHLNPNVRSPVNDILKDVINIHLLEPLGYLDFMLLFKRSDFIMTDSGGIQEEAPSLSKPVVILREVSERPEVIQTGAGILVGSSKNKIKQVTNELLQRGPLFDKMSSAKNPFGDGYSSKKILEICKKHLDKSNEKRSEQ
ncbi:MAG: UDP-N-acetylglucosamine 2-epimerase (non-hydrolyzing) [Bdellovibrionales bacterium]|nr:UDP-N-acetylglucosamine 2-epimerase (non-hydrolyzing) [Bdellovibrionales bacterium]